MEDLNWDQPPSSFLYGSNPPPPRKACEVEVRRERLVVHLSPCLLALASSGNYKLKNMEE